MELPPDGPAAHEDLTIAELLETMRATDEHRPGQRCFRGSDGEMLCVSDEHAEAFLADHGAEHPPEYNNAHGHDWQRDFFETLSK